jgi:hypothetical protein
MKARRGAYRVFVGKTGGKGGFVRPRRKWEGNIKIDFWDVGMGRH